MKLKEQLELQKDIEVPWHVFRFFDGNTKKIVLAGDQASLSSEGDFGSLQELQKAVQWYVEQLGGKVKWDK
jgi:hypothetical protein